MTRVGAVETGSQEADPEQETNAGLLQLEHDGRPREGKRAEAGVCFCFASCRVLGFRQCLAHRNADRFQLNNPGAWGHVGAESWRDLVYV